MELQVGQVIEGEFNGENVQVELISCDANFVWTVIDLFDGRKRKVDEENLLSVES